MSLSPSTDTAARQQREVTAVETPTEGTQPPCSAHTKGAHPYGLPETPFPLGTKSHTLPVCPQLGTL